MRHYEELARYSRDGFDIIVDKTWEDLHPGDCFDDSCHDIADLCAKIDVGTYDWFMLRVRAMVDGHEFAADYLGGCLYEDPKEVLTDGTAEDLIWSSLNEAKKEVQRMRQRLELLPG